jgi:hypothetical protein
LHLAQLSAFQKTLSLSSQKSKKSNDPSHMVMSQITRQRA